MVKVLYSELCLRAQAHIFHPGQLIKGRIYVIIITDPYQIPLFSLCNISAIAASTFYQEKFWYSSVIVIDNYFGQTAILDILQPALGFALSSFSEAPLLAAIYPILPLASVIIY